MIKIDLCSSAVIQNSLGKFLGLIVIFAIDQGLNIVTDRIGFLSQNIVAVTNSDDNRICHLCRCHIQNNLFAAGHSVRQAVVQDLVHNVFSVDRYGYGSIFSIGSGYCYVKTHRKIVAQAQLLITNAGINTHNLFQPGNNIGGQNVIAFLIGMQAVKGMHTACHIKLCKECIIIYQIK